MITNKKPLAVYVHIPFCVRKCNYCDFLSGPADRESREHYVAALINEIHSYKELVREYEVKTIFLGGGTPSSLEAVQIARIMEALKTVFQLQTSAADELEITMEMNPGTVTREKLQTYYDAGINRISFGLQSANDEELKLLGRIHTFEQFVDNYQMAREIGFQNINIDLMSALPGQTIESYRNTLEKVMNLQPEHISAYSLIIEEGTPFYEVYGEDSKQTPDKKLPGEDADREMYALTRKVMHEHGFERYEISNYAKAGYECRHNCTYWRRGDYLGLGSGAASLLKKERFCNERNLQEYIRLAGSDFTEENYHQTLRRDVEELTESDEMEEFMFLGLRLMKGVSIKTFQDTFHTDIFEVYGTIITKLVDEELLQIEQGYLALTEHGIDISNYVMSEFMF